MPWLLFASSFTQKVGLILYFGVATDWRDTGFIDAPFGKLFGLLLIHCTQLTGFRLAQEKGCFLQMGSIA